MRLTLGRVAWAVFGLIMLGAIWRGVQQGDSLVTLVVGAALVTGLLAGAVLLVQRGIDAVNRRLDTGE